MSMKPYYDDGAATLYHGDCVDVVPHLPPVNLMVTSPPYGELRDYGGHGFDFERVADALVPALAPGGVLVWVVDDATEDGAKSLASFKQCLGFVERGLILHDTIIYQKAGSSGLCWPNRHQRGHEYMFILSMGCPNHVNIIQDKVTHGGVAGRGGVREKDGSLTPRTGGLVRPLAPRNTVWAYDNGWMKGHPGYPQAHNHPATFPIALARDHIRTWSEPGDVVYDPLAGSGTTLRAAKDLNRRAYGSEIHAPYCEIAAQRLRQNVFDFSALEAAG